MSVSHLLVLRSVFGAQSSAGSLLVLRARPGFLSALQQNSAREGNKKGFPHPPCVQPVRHHYRRSIRSTYLELNARLDAIKSDERIRQGHENIERRADFIEWNYDAELYAFKARIREKFDDELLRQALLDPSYVEAERSRQVSLGMEEAALAMVDNTQLVEEGEAAAEGALREFLRAAFPFLPEEGVQAFVGHLQDVEEVSQAAFHIGTKDLIKSKEYPPCKETQRKTFYALVGALKRSVGGEERWRRFVIDFLGARLHGKDLADVWDVRDPMGTLARVLQRAGRGEPESRLLWESGADSLLGCCHVGVYSDRELIGQSPGETSEIAEEMAARDSLRRLFQISDSDKPMPLGDEELAELQFSKEPNLLLEEWTEEEAGARAKVAGNIVRLEEGGT